MFCYFFFYLCLPVFSRYFPTITKIIIHIYNIIILWV